MPPGRTELCSYHRSRSHQRLQGLYIDNTFHSYVLKSVPKGQKNIRRGVPTRVSCNCSPAGTEKSPLLSPQDPSTYRNYPLPQRIPGLSLLFSYMPSSRLALMYLESPCKSCYRCCPCRLELGRRGASWMPRVPVE